MKMRHFPAFLKIGMAVALLSGSAVAADEVVENTISEWKFGETIFGRTVDSNGLEGMVVAIEYWGAGCDESRRNMSRLVKVERKYRNQGLRVIAAEIQGSSKENIRNIVEKNNIEFSVTKGVAGPLSVRGMPYAIVFGTDGKIVFDGRPGSEEFEKAIEAALRGVEMSEVNGIETTQAPALVLERTWTNSKGKPLVASVTEIRDGKVIFKLKDGKEVPYAIEQLSEQDQQLLKKEIPR